MPPQEEIPRNGYAIQCRVTTEDPENKFMPDYGRILTYRSPGGFGIRLDGGMGYGGAVITPFYDSLLVKVIASAPRPTTTRCSAWTARCAEFRIRGVKTNIPFLENVIQHEKFRTGQATTTLIDTTPELFKFKPRRDRATKLLDFLGDVIVNGNPHAKGLQAGESRSLPATAGGLRPQAHAAAGHAPFAAQARAEEIRRMDAASKSNCSSPTRRCATRINRCMATRVRTYDMLAVAGAVARRTPELFSLEMWGGATFDTAMRFLNEDPWDAAAPVARRGFRTSVSRCCFAARTPWVIPIIRTMSSPVS